MRVQGGCERGLVLINLLVMDQTSSFFWDLQNSLKLSDDAEHMASAYLFLRSFVSSSISFRGSLRLLSLIIL